MESEESPVRPRALEDAFNQQPSSDDGTPGSASPAAAAAAAGGHAQLALPEGELQSLEVVATLEGVLPGGDSEDLEAVAPTAPSVAAAAAAAGEGEEGQGAGTQQAAALAGSVSVVLSAAQDGITLSLAV